MADKTWCALALILALTGFLPGCAGAPSPPRPPALGPPPQGHRSPQEVALELLRDLAASGTELVYFEGNHDFHMGPFFTETLKARVFRGPATIDLDGKRVYLCHGDQINRRDVGYLLLRLLLHNALTGMVARLVPASIVSVIADRMSRLSRKNHHQRRVKWDYVAILREFATARFREGCDAVITGHFHTPLLEKSPNGGSQTLLSLGDWITHFSYGEWKDGELSLKKFA